ncbi:MAG TPA: DMT family transporter [Trebonia sp.]|jgi:drug/metabolite transporter (DMT)-like permease|nr:DMT family transporter [Trebonia sp.]
MAIGRGSLTRLTLLALLWGSSFLWIAIALRGFSPVQIVLIRLALGALVLVAILYTRGLRLPGDRMIWLHLVVAAIFANAIPYTLFAIGEKHVSSSVAGVLNATTPLWTLVIAFATGHERRVSGPKLTGFIIGLAGTLLIFSPWETGSQIASAGGLACLGASASYGVSYVYMDRYLARRGIPPLVLSAGQLIAATVEMAIVLSFAGLQPIHWRPDAIAALAVLGALGTGIAYVLNYRLITDEGTTASVVTYLLPIVAVILGAAILGDHITAQIIAGMLIILLGVALTRRVRHSAAVNTDLRTALPKLAIRRQAAHPRPHFACSAHGRPWLNTAVHA